ncbi:MAG: DUF368 domain-containing protein [Pseudomonadota bacterium]
MPPFASLFLKGLAMGAANVVPGVSGGTVALVTGVYERLINALRRCDLQALRLLFAGDLKRLWAHVDGAFLAAIGLGVAASIFSLAKLLEFLLSRHETLTMAFFFGLITVSVFSVGRTVRHWTTPSWAALVVGAATAVGIALLAPAGENTGFAYLVVCGVVAICSMILPGLSGSFVLIIMGNYALVLGAVSRLDFAILLPVALGCVVGLLAFSHVLGWVYARYHDHTVALMTGFIVGSLVVIWPFKTTLTALVERVGKPSKEIVIGYQWHWPDASLTTGLAAAAALAGAVGLVWVERLATRP